MQHPFGQFVHIKYVLCVLTMCLVELWSNYIVTATNPSVHHIHNVLVHYICEIFFSHFRFTLAFEALIIISFCSIRKFVLIEFENGEHNKRDRTEKKNITSYVYIGSLVLIWHPTLGMQEKMYFIILFSHFCYLFVHLL